MLRSAYLILCVINFAPNVLGLGEGDSCVTPNGEIGKCTKLHACSALLQSILTGDDASIEFTKTSQCGDPKDRLVCCGSNTKFITNSDLPENGLLPNRSFCGIESENDRVFGGNLTEPHEFPWMALLGYSSSFTPTVGFKCGGTLINKRYVLTAAHCINISPDSGLTLDVVRLGEWQISENPDCSSMHSLVECVNTERDYKIEKKIPHPQYNRKSGNNDIGLLRLAEDAELSAYIIPICLPLFNTPYPENRTRLIVAGWGSTEKGSSSDYKLKLEVPVMPLEECAKILKGRGEISLNQICAGGEAGRDSCQGDSGGPLMGRHEYENTPIKQWYQEGVIAWGVGCAKANVPAAYTRVTRYLNWIFENLEE